MPAKKPTVVPCRPRVKFEQKAMKLVDKVCGEIDGLVQRLHNVSAGLDYDHKTLIDPRSFNAATKIETARRQLATAREVLDGAYNDLDQHVCGALGGQRFLSEKDMLQQLLWLLGDKKHGQQQP